MMGAADMSFGIDRLQKLLNCFEQTFIKVSFIDNFTDAVFLRFNVHRVESVKGVFGLPVECGIYGTYL